MDQKYHKRVIIVTVNCALVVHPSETCAFCTSLASRTPRNGEKISFKFATLQPVSRSLGANGRPRSLSQGGRQSGDRRKSPGYSRVRCCWHSGVHIIHELLIAGTGDGVRLRLRAPLIRSPRASDHTPTTGSLVYRGSLVVLFFLGLVIPVNWCYL